MLKTPHLKYQPVYLYLRTLVLDPVPNFNTPPFGGGVDSCYLQVNIIKGNHSWKAPYMRFTLLICDFIHIYIRVYSLLFTNVFELNPMYLSGILYEGEIVSPVSK